MSVSGIQSAAAGAGLRRLTLRRPGFLGGLVLGVVLVFVLRFVVNQTEFADRLVSPLLVSDSDGQADAIVVLGAGVVGECGVNQNGVRRVLLAARLWKAGRAPVVMITGGAYGTTCPVAVAMAALAREVGIPEASIRLETASRSTRENAEFSAPLLRAMNAQRLLLVTDRLHMPRSVGAFTNLGFDVERASVPVFEGHPNNVSMLAAAFREGAALAYYRMHGWVGPGLPSAAARSERGGVPAARATAKGMAVEAVANPNGPLVVHGASYAGGWDLKKVGPLAVVNTGVAGQQSFEMLERFERDVVAAKPRAVLLWGFINDIFRADPAVMDAAIARVQDSYTRMIAIARANGIEPVLATEVTVRPKGSWSDLVLGPVAWVLGKESNEQRINRRVLETNRWLMGVARQERLLLLDLQGATSEANGRRRRGFAQPDGSHITPAGYAAITAYVTPILEAQFMGRGAGR